jgi:arylsulfatase A-like enzyme
VKTESVEHAIHGYLASVSYADAMLGRILKALQDSPYADNTIVVLWSDHGYHHGEKGDWGKHTLWERTSNVPFIWSGVGLAKQANVPTTVSLIDMYPTFIDLCGLPAVADLDGTSIAGTLKDPSTASDRNVLLPYLDPGGYAIINDTWRYIHYSDETEELYQVKRDPHEWTNLANRPQHRSVIKELQAAAPKEFASAGTPKKKLKLVTEQDAYHWKTK